MKTDESPGEESPAAQINRKIAWLETFATALDARAITVLHEVFPSIMEQRYDRAWRRLRRKGLSEQQAEDLLQEAFTALFYRVRDRGVRGSIQVMFSKILKGKLINHLRDQCRAPETLALPSSGSSLPDSAVDLERALDLRELSRRFLRELSPAHQAVVEKAILRGLSDEEAAAALGLRVGTLKSRLRAATRALHALGAAWLPPSQQEAA